MKKLSLILSVLIGNVAMAQTTSISGQLLDKTTNEALQYANVQIYSLPDSTFLKGDVTKDDGSFKIEGIKAEKCVVKASFIGYTAVYKNVTVKTGQDNPVGKIYLLEDSKQLAEVSIIAEATPMTVKDDTVIFNADAFHVTEGAVLEDLVKKMPGPEVSDGEVTVNGNKIGRVLMNGKEFYSSDPQVALKNLPANMVKDAKTYSKRSEQAELTGMEDEEEEWVLDFTVRKGFMNGWIGKVWAAGGHDIEGEDDYRYDGHIDLNTITEEGNFSVIAGVNNINNASALDDMRSGGGNNRGGGMGGGGMMMMMGMPGGGMMGGNRGSGSRNGMGGGMMMMMGGITSSASVNASLEQEPSKSLKYGGDIMLQHQKREQEGSSTVERFLNNGQTSLSNSNSSSTTTTNMLNVSGRLNWGIDTMTTILFRPSLTLMSNESNTSSASNSFGTMDLVTMSRDSVNKSTYSYDDNSTSLNYNLSFQIVRKLNNNGRSITLGVRLNGNASPSEGNTLSDAYYFNFNRSEISDRNSDGKSNSFGYSGEISYVEPLFDKNYLQLRYNYQNTGSDSYSYVYENDSTEYTDSLSSKIENTYIGHRIELTWQGRYDKLRYNLGVTLQPQESKVDNFVGKNVGKDTKQTVLNWAPNVRVQYRFTSTRNLQLRYNGRSSAPSVSYLQEVIDVSNPMSLEYGNPELKPSFNNNISLNFSNFDRMSNRNFIVNLSYSNTINSIATVTYTDTLTFKTESHKENVNGNWRANGFLTFSTPFSNQKFSITSRSSVGYSENVSLTGDLVNGVTQNKKKGTSTSLTLSETLQANYRCDVFDFTLSGSVNYQKANRGNLNNSNSNSETTSAKLSNNGETFNYTVTFDGNLHLPAKFDLSSDFNYRIYQGYGENSNNRNTAIWNAQLSKRFTDDSRWTVRLKVYDILQQQKLISRNVSETSITDSENSTLGCYAMVQVVYTINSVGKNNNQRNGFPGGFGPGGFPGGFGGPGMF